MRRCPKCRTYNDEDYFAGEYGVTELYKEGDILKCQKCGYEFKKKIKKKNPSNDKSRNEPETNEWPSDEWKDWNTM